MPGEKRLVPAMGELSGSSPRARPWQAVFSPTLKVRPLSATKTTSPPQRWYSLRLPLTLRHAQVSDPKKTAAERHRLEALGAYPEVPRHRVRAALLLPGELGVAPRDVLHAFEREANVSGGGQEGVGV